MARPADLHAVAAIGSLAAARRLLDIRQTTFGRRLDTLERVAGDKLVLRLPCGTVLTPFGKRLACIAATVDEVMSTAGRTVRSETGDLAGTVTIAAAPLLATTIVAPGLARFFSPRILH